MCLSIPSHSTDTAKGDAELIYGGFRNRLPREVADRVLAMTKWCIFGPLEKPVTPEFVLEAVKERSRRLGGRVELLQVRCLRSPSEVYC